MSTVIITTLTCAAAPSALAVLTTLAGAGFVGMGIYKLAENYLENYGSGEEFNMESFAELQMQRNRELLEMMERNIIASYESKIDDMDDGIKEELMADIAALKEEFSMVYSQYTIDKFDAGRCESEFYTTLRKLEDHAMKIRHKIECHVISQSQDCYDPFRGNTGVYGSRKTEEKQRVALGDLVEEKAAFNADDVELLKSDIEYFCRLLLELDPSSEGMIESMTSDLGEETGCQKLEMTLLSVKLKYGKVLQESADRKIYAELLNNIKVQIEEIPGSEELKSTIDSTLESSHISAEQFRNVQMHSGLLIQDYLKLQMEKVEYEMIARKIYAELNALGYNVIQSDEEDFQTRLKSGEILYLDTEDPEYKVMIKMDDELVFRFVRIVSSEEEKTGISTYQREKDAEKAQQWCDHFDQFSARLKMLGIDCGVGLRKEAGESEVLYVVDPGKVKPRAESVKKPVTKDRMLRSEP